MLHSLAAILFFVSSSTLVGVARSDEGFVQEYCPGETFHAECPMGKVIFMTAANYGRMKLGRCISKDLGYIGCKRDIIIFTDHLCSGRRECDIAVTDISKEFQPCLAELSSYLEASFECVEVIREHEDICSVENNIHVNAVTGIGYFANVVTEETGQGSPDCPWIIYANKGQYINITLLDFTNDSSFNLTDIHNRSVCHVLAIIKDKYTRQSRTICSGHQRERQVFISKSDQVEIRVVRTRQASDMPKKYFMIKFEAMGCSDHDIDVRFLRERGGNFMTLICPSTLERWHLTCREKKWIGEVGSCPTSVEGCEDPETPANSVLMRNGSHATIRCPSSGELWMVVCHRQHWIGEVGSCPDNNGEIGDGPVQEYCLWETFHAECQPGEVIQMKYAQYGRMRKGRCLYIDFGYLGCAVNVLPIIDGMCTGQNHCDVPLLNQQFHSLNPCPSDLMPYLEASYECMKGDA